MPPPDPNQKVIEMHGVALGAMQDPEHAILSGIDWTVRAGDFWVIAGLQGSGKTDFLMMTGGVMAPLSGTYQLFGEPMPIFDEARLQHRLRLGLVFDGGQLLNHLTVGENVALPLRYHRNLSALDARPEVLRMLEALELGPWADSTPGALGRNWQKRVGLARALMLKPDVLLIDNPLGGLDLRHVSWWLDFLQGLSTGRNLMNGQPVTLVVTTADLRLWKERAKQFAVLHDHQFFVLGGWAEVQAAPERTREVLPG
jgi:putative ABC transport system ATP-binding protein